jgi:hypothetical protein
MRILPILVLVAILGSACGRTLVLELPEAPPNPFAAPPLGPEPPPRVECEFMSVWIDSSRRGDRPLAARVVRAMKREFETFGARVVPDPDDAYWSLMILAARDGRGSGGFVFSGLLTSRNMNEGYDPGVTVYANEAPEARKRPGPDTDAEADAEPRWIEKLPTMYNGLSYGTDVQLEDQARAFVRQAYAAVFPAAEQLCQFQAADRARERALDRQLGVPEPL